MFVFQQADSEGKTGDGHQDQKLWIRVGDPSQRFVYKFSHVGTGCSGKNAFSLKKNSAFSLYPGQHRSLERGQPIAV